jgi:hypothetical protein
MSKSSIKKRVSKTEEEEAQDPQIISSLTYDDIMGETLKPVAERKKIHNPRLKRDIMPRRFHMTDEKLKQCKETAIKMKQPIGNPYSRSGAYYGFVQSLLELGIDTWHDYASVVKKMEEIMTSIVNCKGQDAWSAFSNKKARNHSTGKDLSGRILQNASVLQRIDHNTTRVGNASPYGFKLQQQNACIDIKGDAAGKVFFRLNTKFANSNDVKPIKGLSKKKKTKAP